ncbi:unnamed protein product [Caenorhabditis angaria]|uniref:Uncharacterized protein n=1 Tax=Caenorhabditis angaria TaxID=860376 RepID=A0A9P1IU60_9PELO|nr:unnamed protein product [Caenorhabditis angaria]
MRKFMSVSTFKLHKTALVTLVLQCFIPFSCVGIPLIIIFTVILNNYVEYQELATDTMILISTHSMVSTIVMIASNSHFMEKVREILRFFKTSTPKINSIVERTIQI